MNIYSRFPGILKCQSTQICIKKEGNRNSVCISMYVCMKVRIWIYMCIYSVQYNSSACLPACLA